VQSGDETLVEREPSHWLSLEALTDRLKEFFHARHEAVIVYLYGSFLKRSEWHDVDVAVLLDPQRVAQGFDLLRYGLQVGAELEQFLGRPRVSIDLRVLNDAPLVFQNEVIKTGVPIVVRDEQTRIAYEAKVLIEFLDFLPVLEMYERALFREIRQWS